MRDHDWRLAPMAGAAWLGAWVGTRGEWPLTGAFLIWVPLLGVLVLGHWAWRRTSWLATAGVVLLVVGLLAGARSTQLHTSVPARMAQATLPVQVVVQLVGDPRALSASGSRPPLVVARATLLEVRTSDQHVRTSQPLSILASGESAAEVLDARPGGRYRMSGILGATDPQAPEALQLRLRRVETTLADPGILDRVVNDLRSGLRRSTAHSPPDQAALLPSLVVGDTSGIEEQLTEDFRTTSLSHLLAVSGANLTLLLGVVLGILRLVGVQGWWSRGASVVCVAFFVLLCRSEPSVVRAAAMGLVALAAMGTGTGRRSLRHLFVAVFALMLVDPWLSRSWGFALSAAACAGIAVWLPLWTGALTTWLPRWLAEALALPLAAQLATQPLVTALNGQVSVVGVVANLAAGPFVGPATVLGMAATMMVWLPPAATALAWLAGWFVQPIIWVAALGADLPGASRPWPATPAGIALLVTAVIALSVLLPWVLVRPLVSAVLLVVVLVAMIVQPVPGGWPKDWHAVFCDVGQGDATLLRAGERDAVLVDTGPDPGSSLRCLRLNRVTAVPVLVLTHFHSDHVGGAVELIRRYRPVSVVISPLEHPTGAAAAVRATAAAVGAAVTHAAPGQVWEVGGARLQVVGAAVSRVTPVAGSGESAEENNSSVMVVAEVDGLRLLLPGDAEPEAQRRVVRWARENAVDLGVDVLKLPHHGSSRQDPEFFDASGASLAVASSGQDNEYGHPSRAALAMAIERGMQVVRTDEQGSLAVTHSGDALDVVATR